jgi:thiosulfate/3-mercaptopyruvate sulfurtransferase
MLLPMRSRFLPDSKTFKLLSIASTMLVMAAFAFAQNSSKEDVLARGSKNLIQPADLAKALQSNNKPMVLYVGPAMFYQHAHVAGAEFVGQAGRADGLAKLHARAASLPHEQPIVIYCGCCPWEHCPNIRPAFRELEKMGFTNVRVLYLPTSFGVDWAEKGYPIAKGE